MLYVYADSCVSFYQVIIPDHLRGRVLHTTTIVHCDSTRRQLVAYGGLYEIPEDGEESSAIPVADTTIVELGKWDLYLTPHSCGRLISLHCQKREGLRCALNRRQPLGILYI